MFKERTRYEFVNYWMVRPRSSVWSGRGIYWAWAPGETNDKIWDRFDQSNTWNILNRKSLVLKTNAAPHLVEKLSIAGTVLWNRIYWKHIKIARQDAILIITREMLEYSNLRQFAMRVQPLSYGRLMVLLYLPISKNRYRLLRFRKKSATIVQNSAIPTFFCEKICTVYYWIPDWFHYWSRDGC